MEHAFLSHAEIEAEVVRGMASLPLRDKRVLVLIPDGTRTFPQKLFFDLLTRHLRGVARACHFLVALGTHPPLSEAGLWNLVGHAGPPAEPGLEVRMLNHAWRDPDALATLGEISEDEVFALSGGRLRMSVPVRLNKLVLEYDHILVCGPVFPHEVVGFSGGNKYFFPGISGPEMIDFTHWLGSLITSYVIIGTPDTPVRNVINRAAGMIPTPRHAICSVVTHGGVHGVYFGTPEDAWARAAALSAQVHIRWTDRRYKRVLSIMPEMYDELWVGSKGMYKAEPVVEDGGEVVIYAPHMREISVTHGAIIRKVGYHVRDYILAHWDELKGLPWGVLAHSTHLRGTGTYDAATGTERARIAVTLATGIPEAETRAVNLTYRAPESIDIAAWERDPDTLVIPRAGEYLYRQRPA